MAKLQKSIKVISINLFLLSISCLIFGEFYLRIFRPKFPIEVQGDSYTKRLNKAKKDSRKEKLLMLTIGDSFAHHQIGTNGNFFDTTFNCKNKIKCYYHNLAQSGEGLDFYWNTILASLEDRNLNHHNRIVVSIYFGNDIPKVNNKIRLDYCKSIHKLDPRASKHLVDTKILSIKRKIPSLLLIARGLKSYTGIGAKDNSKQIISNAKSFRLTRTDPNQRLENIDQLFHQLDPSIIQAVNKSSINPWEISLGLANPYYYDNLYNLDRDWSYNSVKCLTENIVSNLNSIKNKYPNTEFLIVGIPDKFFWSQASYEVTTEEYKDLGYRFKKKPINLPKTPLYKLFSNKLKLERINFIYLPNLIDQEQDIADWFYYKDMHINAKGNIEISKLMKDKIFWNDIQKN